MRVTLTVLAGPNVGHVIDCDGHDGFVVGRSKRTAARLPHKDGFLSRYHFLLEVNPPLCRVVDLESRNGTFVNGEKVATADLHDGDILKAGHTAFRVRVERPATPEADDRDRTSVHSPPGLTADIPGYRPVREVGRGGMGVVYEAVREADGLTVALKTIRPAADPTRAAVERFLRESAILRQLDHPNIVRYLDGGEADGTLWFAMEFVPGVDAGRWVKRHDPMPIADAVANAVLRGLEYAHSLGFVHRDVKPSNVLLEPQLDGSFGVKLADFGLARAYDDSRMSGLTLTGDIGGTPAFMAPEQILDFRNVGPPADIYGSAATLYYLLTGAFIFDLPDGAVAAYAMILEDEPVPIRERRPDVPQELAGTIVAGLTKDPARRVTMGCYTS